MRIGTQIVLGEQERRLWDKDALTARIRAVNETVPLDRLLVWNKLDRSWMDAVTALCRNLQIQVYAWFPVLADPLSEAFEREELILTAAGQRGYGRHGIWEELTRENDLGEDFLFACPNKEQVTEKCRRDLEAVLSEADVDGVFLDRIRYPSPANGIETLASCLCSDCERAYHARFDRPYIMPWQRDAGWAEATRALLHGEAGEASLDTVVDILGLGRFVAFREESVSRQVAALSATAREAHKKVGLDLFTPSLSRLVGQSYRRLSEYGDWIKPMSYCKALGPAGISLEIGTLARGLQSLFRENGIALEEAEIMDFLGRVFRLELPQRVDTLYREGVPEHTVEQEYRVAAWATAETNTEIWPGIELVNNPAFTTAITETQCRRYLAAMQKTGADWIACWNLLYIPQRYFELIADSLDARHS